MINQKQNQRIGIEIIMQLNSIFTKLQTVVKFSNKMEGSSASVDYQVHASQGAGTDEAVMVTKRVRLVGKLL